MSQLLPIDHELQQMNNPELSLQIDDLYLTHNDELRQVIFVYGNDISYRVWRNRNWVTIPQPVKARDFIREAKEKVPPGYRQP